MLKQLDPHSRETLLRGKDLSALLGQFKETNMCEDYHYSMECHVEPCERCGLVYEYCECREGEI